MSEATGADRAPGLQEAITGDLEAVARLKGELFGVETQSRDLLAAELVAFHGPMTDRCYVIIKSEESDGDGDAYDAADYAVGTGSRGSWLPGYTGFYHAGGLTSVDLLVVATVPTTHGRGTASLTPTELISTIREVSRPNALLEVR